ncbi:GIY-YIG nuclease family protein [Mariniflexile sp. HMF6888]|uniref:GIY-YIG nuclease family protein n=1 Tax=Mariniflexile sp. HMF6888 TaxID=3373086 RepID=UPI0037B6635F
MTNNISRRIEKHQKGWNKTCFTYKRKPLELIFYQKFNDANQAIYFEKKIKNLELKKENALTNEEYNMLQILLSVEM